MESLEFTDDEIKRQLSALGYSNISEPRMKQFRKDLHKLIEHDRSTSGSSSWFTGVSSPSSNSDYSETSDQAKQAQRSTFSRFQPHIKRSPRETVPSSHFTMPVASSNNDDSSWIAKHDIPESSFQRNRNLSPTDFQTQPTEQQDSLDSPTSYTTGGITHCDPPRWLDVNETNVASHGVTSGRGHTSAATMDSGDDSDRSFIPTPPPNEGGRVVRKRKVLRKQRDGTPRVFDESLMEEPGRGMYRIHDISMDDSDPRLSRVTQKPFLPPRPHSTKPILWKKDSPCEFFTTTNQPPSYIRSNLSHPHTRNIKKTDPVNRFRQYKDFWDNVKAPGEKTHKSLRWEMKAQMMYKEEPAPRQQRVYVPNSYVVPTSKKRLALRWEVRHAIAQGLPIPSTYDVY